MSLKAQLIWGAKNTYAPIIEKMKVEISDAFKQGDKSCTCYLLQSTYNDSSFWIAIHNSDIDMKWREDRLSSSITFDLDF